MLVTAKKIVLKLKINLIPKHTKPALCSKICKFKKNCYNTCGEINNRVFANMKNESEKKLLTSEGASVPEGKESTVIVLSSTFSKRPVKTVGSVLLNELNRRKAMKNIANNGEQSEEQSLVVKNEAGIEPVTKEVLGNKLKVLRVDAENSSKCFSRSSFSEAIILVKSKLGDCKFIN